MNFSTIQCSTAIVPGKKKSGQSNLYSASCKHSIFVEESIRICMVIKSIDCN